MDNKTYQTPRKLLPTSLLSFRIQAYLVVASFVVTTTIDFVVTTTIELTTDLIKIMIVSFSLLLTIASAGATVRNDHGKDEKALLSQIIASINRFRDGKEKKVIIYPPKTVDGQQLSPPRRQRRAQRNNGPFKAEQGGATTDGEKSENKLNSADVGVLSLGRSSGRDDTVPRILQTTEELCNAGVCGPSYCDCYANSWRNNETDVMNQVPCAAEAYKLCNGYTDGYGNEWTMVGCVGKYRASRKCEQAKCDVIDGGTLADCICQSSISYCTNYGELYMVSTK